MTTLRTPASLGYAAAKTATAVARLDGWGWLRLSGRDRLSFLQRLSTNDLRDLTAGQGRPTVLATGTGRVIALLFVYVDAEAVYVRTERGQGASVRRYLDKLIFWNDEVQIADTGADVAQWAVLGPRAAETMAQFAGGGNELAELPPHGWCAASIGAVAVTVQRGGPLALPTWTVMAPAADASTVDAALAGLAPWLNPGEVEPLRVEAGIPAWGRELTDQVTPLEAGLAGAVSFNKGCYTGQEVIARQHNYDKVPRRLAGLLLPSGSGAELAGAAVRGAGATPGGRPGYVGTVVESPALGRSIALAIVPSHAAEPGSQVTLAGQAGEVIATVAALPFASDYDSR